MREKLANYIGQNVRATGTFECLGKRKTIIKSKKGRFLKVQYIPTILVKDVFVGDNFVCKHTWLDCGEMNTSKLNKGDILTFEAKVDFYIKGHLKASKSKITGNIMEYGLFNVRNIKKSNEKEV